MRTTNSNDKTTLYLQQYMLCEISVELKKAVSHDWILFLRWQDVINILATLTFPGYLCHGERVTDPYCSFWCRSHLKWNHLKQGSQAI